MLKLGRSAGTAAAGNDDRIVNSQAIARTLITSATAATVQNAYACDTSGGTFAVTLPLASLGKGRIVIAWVQGTLPPTIALSGGDHLDYATGPTSDSLTASLVAKTYESDGNAMWIRTSNRNLDVDFVITPITTATTAVAGAWYRADPTAGTFLVTLPAVPVDGDIVLLDNVGTGNTVTYIRGGTASIEGLTTALTLQPNDYVQLNFRAANNTWYQRRTLTTAVAGTDVRRDGSGRAQVTDPVAGADIATKNYVDARGVAANWAATTAFSAYQLVRLPTGGLAYSTTSRTSRASFDATERATWVFMPGGHYEFVASPATSWTCPTGIDHVRLRLAAGGGGGGGGGSALTSGGTATQVGGGGGGAGGVHEVEVPSLVATTAYTLACGAAGAFGTAAAANGNAGGQGGTGGDTTFVGPSFTYTAKGGGGGANGLANSAATSGGGMYATASNVNANWIPGSGGNSQAAAGGIAPVPIGPVCGGGGGAPASATLGGAGGLSRTAPGAGFASLLLTTKNGTTAGLQGVDATQFAHGGGGGGGGAPGGVGARGGAGAAGFIEVWF